MEDGTLAPQVQMLKFSQYFPKSYISEASKARVGISGATAKSRKRKFVPLSHPGPFAVVATSGKSQTKVGTLACFDFLYQNELTM